MSGHYEVFRRERQGEPLEHAGSVEAPDERLAVIYARQVFGRRGESETLWIVPRDEIIVTPGPHPELDRSYRRVDGYSIKQKLRAVRERVEAERTPGAGA